MAKPDEKKEIGPLYRARLSCKIARDAIEGKAGVPSGVSPEMWVLFNLLHAIEDIAMGIEQKKGDGK